MTTQNYNETDASVFIRKSVAQELQKKYSLEQIEYLLDLVYEYYDSLEDLDDNPVIQADDMVVFINDNISDNFCEAVERNELEQILNADNKYMESIGLLEPEEESEAGEDDFIDENIINLDEVIEDIYPLLPAEIQEKYDIEKIYALLCIECDFLDDLEDADIDTEKLHKYILEQAIEEEIHISLEELKAVLAIEAKVLGED